jgi:hypothetical protein
MDLTVPFNARALFISPFLIKLLIASKLLNKQGLLTYSDLTGCKKRRTTCNTLRSKLSITLSCVTQLRTKMEYDFKKHQLQAA